MTVIQFTPLSSLVQPAFWHDLVRLKIDVLKLSSESQTVTASYSAGKSIVDRETGQDVALGCQLVLGGDGLNPESRSCSDHDFSIPTHAVGVKGTLKNYNTVEDFKAADKSALFNELADELWSNMNSETGLADLSYLNKFLVLTFADLKKYKFFYWFAFPAFVAKPAWEIDVRGWLSAEEQLGRQALESIHTAVSNPPGDGASHVAFFIARPTKSSSGEVTYETASVGQWGSFFNGVADDKVEFYLLGIAHPAVTKF
ncbi:Autophagy protein 7 [Ceratobasidium sp. 414]|nr:Autophagy protein 7 [Ceratobasidium sp. 414]